jgi:hypothetical protein
LAAVRDVFLGALDLGCEVVPLEAQLIFELDAFGGVLEVAALVEDGAQRVECCSGVLELFDRVPIGSCAEALHVAVRAGFFEQFERSIEVVTFRGPRSVVVRDVFLEFGLPLVQSVS